MLFAELCEIGDAHHATLGMNDLDPDAAGVESCESTEIDDTFGVTDADEDAAIAGTQWIDVSGTHEVSRDRGGVDQHLDGLGAFVGADSGREAVLGVTVDGNSQRRPTRGCIHSGLSMQVQTIAVRFWERDEHVSRCFFEHEHNRFGGDELSREDEVALVLA